MVQKVAVFIDYQNVYRRARDAFAVSGNHTAGQVRPIPVGLRLRGDQAGTRELAAVHIYRGMPVKSHDEKGHSAAQRQIAAWQDAGGDIVHVHTRPLNYRDPEVPREKGIDVSLAVDLVLGIARDDFQVGIVFSEDTDLHPALEAVGELRGPGHCELAIWRDPMRNGPRVVMSGGQRVFTHILNFTDYSRLVDHQDYTKASSRKQRPPRRS